MENGLWFGGQGKERSMAVLMDFSNELLWYLPSLVLADVWKRFKKTIASCSTFLFLPHFDVSVIYYWTDARQHGIYLANKNTSGSLGERKMLWENEPQASASTAFSSSPKLSRVFVFNNYSPKARRILSNNPRDEVEGIIRQYSPRLRRIIVLV